MQIGAAQTGTFTITADRTLCSPDVIGAVVDINETTIALTGNANRLVKYCSTAKCTIAAEPKNAANIEEKKIAGEVVEADVLNILNVESSNIPFSAKDSRGYLTECTVSVDMIPYVMLTSNPSIKRTDPTSGNAQLIVQGNYYQGSFGVVENSLAVKYKVSSDEYVEVIPTIGEDNGYTASVVIPNLDYTKSYSVEVVVTDALSTVIKTVTVGKGVPVFDWGEKDFRFNVPVYMGEVDLDYIKEQGEANGWYYRKWSSGVAECWKKESGTVSCDEAWGSLYYGAIPASNFPTDLFKEKPVLIVDIENQNLFLVKYAATVENTGRSFAVSPSATSNQQYIIQYIAKGRWK